MSLPTPNLPRNHRRLEDRIRELSQCIASAVDYDSELAITELRAAMAEYKQRVRNRSSAKLLLWPEFPRERRRAA